jgi:hypothetical protein
MTPAEENRYLRNQLADLQHRLSSVQRSTSAEERNEIAAATARCDAVARLYGTTASAPVPGETPLAYRRRLAAHYQRYSKTFAQARLDALDAATFEPVESTIFAEAAEAARDPASYGPGELVAVQERDSAGRLVTKYYGDPLSWMAAFMGSGGVVGNVNRNAASDAPSFRGTSPSSR